MSGTPSTGNGPFHGIEEFVAVVERGSIRGAAEALGSPRSTISRRLRELEATLGVELAHRTTREFTLSRAGQTFYKRARVMLDTIRAVRDEVARLDDVPRGVLRVSIPPGPEIWDGSLVSSFGDKYPEVRLEVLATSRAVDLLREEVDVVIRAGRIDNENLVGRKILNSNAVCAATPEYLERFGRPETPEDLASHNCILWMREGHPPTRRWPLRNGGEIAVDGNFASNSLAHLHAQALAGSGIALIPEQLVEFGPSAGQLETLLVDSVGIHSAVWVLYTETRYPLPAVRAFVEHVVDWMKDNVPEPTSG